ncbi:MAG: protein-L-isoaspartate(D-aspartate) O-methyltransferase [Thermoguttaceae bacterium]|jgi:protein-L-isoaspartate(D-aspartate) O-methyltransferase|nr:protein-L-isoaspartate(D-aspartate) O-methyltransferase [Thermoguttaceae bacterium]
MPFCAISKRNSLMLLAVLGLLAPGAASAQTRLGFEQARNRMVDEEIVAAGVTNPRVIEAMRSVPRHEFVAMASRQYAYLDMALPIGEGQTISPPFVVAYMTEAIDPQSTDRVLEIGTGSGYQAAVLSPLVSEVYTIEIVPSLGRNAARTLKRLRYDNVFCKIGDGFLGWPEHAPFDKIIVTCSPERVPLPLVEQLREGGLIVIPVGERYQQTMYVLKKQNGKLVSEALRPTLFVPMTGRAEDQRRVQPDPSNPAIVNGGFEELMGEPPSAAGWHYQRQVELIESDEAPEGSRFARFENAEPGRGCQALQGLAVDGRKVSELELTFAVRGRDLRYGQTRNQAPLVAITFYDENRATIGRQAVGPWRGTFDWQREQARIPVPARAREAILHVGLLGATGQLDLDALALRVPGGR